MNDLYASAVQHVVGIMDQISLLKWPLILSGVGLVECVVGNFRRRGVRKGWAWAFPLFVGLAIGGLAYLSDHGTDATTDIVRFVARLAESSILYCGWVTFAYFMTLRPIKYAGDWMKKHAQAGDAKKE